MIHKPTAQRDQPGEILQGEHALNFYKVMSHWKDGTETLVFAARDDGIFSIELPSSFPRATAARGFNGFQFPDLDFVDICSLGSSSAAALSADGAMVFFRDMLSETEQPITIKFPGIAGTAYRLLNLQGHLVLLTSTALYVLAHLTSRFLDGHPIDREPAFVPSFAMEAVDMNAFRGSEILVVLTEHVELLDVNRLLEQAKHSESLPQSNGKWQRANIAHSHAQVSLGRRVSLIRRPGFCHGFMI